MVLAPSAARSFPVSLFHFFFPFDRPAIFCVHAGIITDLSFATFTVSFRLRLDPLFSRLRLFARLRSRPRVCVPAGSLKWRSLGLGQAATLKRKLRDQRLLECVARN